MCQEFNSEHAAIVLDINMKTGDYRVYFMTDRFGIRPLFLGMNDQGIFFSSELKGLPRDCQLILCGSVGLSCRLPISTPALRSPGKGQMG